MSAQELSDLADDIALHGLRQPVVTYQGAVLDGWHRYQACLHVDSSPRLTEYDGDDPWAFVLSLNMHRRNLTASQRAAAVVACAEWRPKGGDQTKQSAPSAEALSERADVSTRTIEHAKAAQKAGLGEQVRDGKVTAKRAAEVAKLPKRQQAAALQRKSDPPPPTLVEQLSDLASEYGDTESADELAADYESALRIIDADDKLAESMAIIKELRAKYDALEKLYNAQRTDLATMTREAKRWQRKAEGK